MHMSLACPRLARGLLATCMIWQVVPSTGTCKSINLDLARAAPYRYFTQYGPAHADQNLFQQTSFIASFLSVSLVVLLYGVGRAELLVLLRAEFHTCVLGHAASAERRAGAAAPHQDL